MTRVMSCVLVLGAIVPFASIPKGEWEMIRQSNRPAERPHPYVGMWMTADRHVRHNLLPNGRYDEARGNRESAYQGRYEVRGNEIFYRDDTGFTAEGKFVDGVLYHGGMIFFRVD